MRYLFLLFPFFLFANSFKIATYNVENLFDATYQGSEYKEYIPGKHNWNQRVMEIKLNHIAEVICDLDADILGLQEIENSYIFNALQKKLKRVGCAYSYSAITHKKHAPIQVALLSRFPIKKQKELQVSISPLVRNILEVDLNIDGDNLTIFVNHWKSRGRRGFESKRVKYAKVLKKRIDLLPAHKEYIILGDLNSNYNVHLTLDKKIDDTHGLTGLGDILQTVVDKKLITKPQIVKVKKGIHYNPWQELPFENRWNHKFYGNKSTLDHILLPPSMFDGEGIDYVNDSFNVFKPSYLFTKRGYINHWKYKHSRHMAQGYSDHLPLYALFDKKAYIPNKREQSTQKITTESIEYLYKVKSLVHPIKIKNAVVILKRGNHAVIKQTPTGRGIFLYGCAKGLKEGIKYNFLVQSINHYNGLKEITALVKEKEKEQIDLAPYYKSFKNAKKQNEIVKEIIGRYKQNYLYMDGQKIPIHFKKKSLIPKNGSKLKIHYAHLGYYKKLQLVIYHKKDFEILE